MNQGLPSPGVGLAAPNDPRLVSRLAQPHASYINNRPPQKATTTISRLVPYTTTATATVTTPTSSATPSAAAAKSFNHHLPGANSNSNGTSSGKNKEPINNRDDNSEVQFLAEIASPAKTQSSQSQNNSSQSAAVNSNNMRRGPQLKMKSRPKKNQSFNSDSPSNRPSSSQTPETNGQRPAPQVKEPEVAPPSVAKLVDAAEKKINPLTTPDNKVVSEEPKPTSNAPIPATTTTAPPQAPVGIPRIQKTDPPKGGPEKSISSEDSGRPKPLANILRHLPAFRSTSSPAKSPAVSASPATTEPKISTKTPPTATSVPAPAPIITTNSSPAVKETNSKPVGEILKVDKQVPVENTKTNGHLETTTIQQPPSTPRKSEVPTAPSPKTQQPQNRESLPIAFSWDTYLKLFPATLAPKEAFRQDTTILTNKFKLGMKLEAKDPRKNSSWCLATVQAMEGSRLKLRFDGSDSMNDFFELINSENIRPVNARPQEPLLPPMAFKGNLGTYPKFVEKVLMKADTVVASPDCFVPPPRAPEKNLFQTGMKLEAIDKKNPYLICPATVGEVTGDDIKIVFDGWSGSFDYVCRYTSRDIFPANWCRDNNHFISAPAGWEGWVNDSPPKMGRYSSRFERPTAAPSPRTPSKPIISPARTPSKEAHLAKVQLQPRASPIASTPKSHFNQTKSPPKYVQTGSPSKTQATRLGQTSPTTREGKRKISASPEVLPSVESRSQAAPETEQAADEPVEEEDDFILGPKFRCQRTVPYEEWAKAHKLTRVQTVPDEAPVAAVAAAILDDKPTSDDNTTKHEPSPPKEEQITHSSTVSDPSPPLSAEVSTLEPPRPRSRGRPPKKIKLDREVEQEQQALKLPSSAYTSWSVEDVVGVITSDATLEKYSHIFENHEIDGKAFGLLTTDMMINHMGLKIGPVLKIAELIEKVKRFRRRDCDQIR